MKRLLAALLFFGTAWASATGAQTPPANYEKALELIHGFSGAGDALDRAMQLASDLMASHPKSGYMQTLTAEMISTWQLNEGGEPAANFGAVLTLTEQALELNPRLAQAHVARARALLKASRFIPAAEA